jgi:riboflavin kinase / FMN adenylyltransferase
MRIIEGFSPSQGSCGLDSAVTLGTFDGVHIGHQEILGRVIRRAGESHIDSVVVTFDRHPSAVLKPESFPGLLTTLDEKIEAFSRAGIQVTCILTFTEEIAAMSAGDFIRDYLVGCLGMKWFVAGYDHGFGRGRGASSEEFERYAAEYGFSLETVEPVIHSGTLVKSSEIRVRISKGDVAVAASLLGREYSLRGTVVHGTGEGRKIGFPTANLLPDSPDKLIPGKGVYEGKAVFGETRAPCVISIGPRPTFGPSPETIEAHIPGFSGNLYDTALTLEFTRRLRDITAFASAASLAEQIRRDIDSIHLY